MDDDDAYLESIDDLDPFEEEGESDNDVLDNIDEEQADIHTDIEVIQTSPPMHQRETGDEKLRTPISTTSDLMKKCDKSVHALLSSLVPQPCFLEC